MTEAKDTLDEFLSDPMIQLVMARDRVSPQDVRVLLEGARSRGTTGAPFPPAHVISESCRYEGMCARM